MRRSLLVPVSASVAVAALLTCGIRTASASSEDGAASAPSQVADSRAHDRAQDTGVRFPPEMRTDDADQVDGADNTDPSVIDGEIAIDLRDDLTDSAVAALEAEYGSAFSLTTHDASSWSHDHDKLVVGDLSASTTGRETELLNRMAEDLRIEAAEPMGVYKALFVPNDPLYTEKQWHLQRVDAPKAWNYGCGQGVTVAVIDTGVACFDKGPFTRGTDLAGTRCEGGYNFVSNSKEAYDDNGHGTHVAGTIAQTTDNGHGGAGLAYCANIMPIKVLSKSGSGSLAQVAEGIRFAADNGAQVINMSLGGPFPARILGAAVKHAIDKGVLVVAAAGNSGRSVGYPAAYDGVLAVSATDRNDNLAWFSSRGKQVGIAAPGVAVTQQTICNGGVNRCEIFGTFNGTSMASPHVAGAAAMLVGEGVTDPHAIRAMLEKTAIPKENTSQFGAGILDAGKAMARAHWLHVLLRGVALFAALAWVRRRITRRGGKFAMTPLATVAALSTSTGLFAMLPVLPFVQGMIPRTLAFMLAHPIGEWSLLSSAGLHRFLPLASAFPLLALAALFFGVKRVRPLIGGLSMGTAALLVQLSLSADVAFIGGPMVLRVWTVLNAFICLWLARLALDAKRS